jgi:acyl-CoA thioesterase
MTYFTATHNRQQATLSSRFKFNLKTHTVMSKDLFTRGQTILESQPFSQAMEAKLARLEPGFAELHLHIHPKLLQQHGFVHGGAVSYLADNALTFAGGSVLGDSVTAEFKINYVRPALGKRLVAKARVVHAGRSLAVCSCEIYCIDEQGEKLCAMAQGTINKVS